MRDYPIDRKASDPDQTDPGRAVASLQGIAAAWLVVLAAALVTLLPSTLSTVEALVVHAAHVVRSEIMEFSVSTPNALQPHDLIMNRGPDMTDVHLVQAVESRRA